MLYEILVRTFCEYDHAAKGSRHLLRLMPLAQPGVQRLVAGSIEMRPKPQERSDRQDFFGNFSTEAVFAEAHDEVEMILRARVERQATAPALDISPPLDQLAAEIEGWRALGPEAPHHYLGPSPLVAPAAEVSAWIREMLAGAGEVEAVSGSAVEGGADAAAEVVSAETIGDVAGDAAAGAVQEAVAADELPVGLDAQSSVLELVTGVNTALHRLMTYDPEATEVDTPLAEAFRLRRGVCQDYAHIMIAALREIGIPAGYVSGLLRTEPPPGQPRLEGADAMHAWIMAWCGADLGWVEFDPTNDLRVGTDHIVVARGRDYSDVAPVKGVLWTSGPQTTRQTVDVIPLG